MTDQRSFLPIGTTVELDHDMYKIIGEPIGCGGGSILYPAQKQVMMNGILQTDGIMYVLKECYPAASSYSYTRANNGEIIPVYKSTEDMLYLHQAQLMQLAEETISKNIYRTASRMLPIRSSAQSVALTLPDRKESVTVSNTMTLMDSLAEKGQSLTTWIKQKRRFSPAEAFRIIQQVLFSLQEVHQAGYLHLDIQDGNVFLRGTLNQKNELVTLIDFGCARKLIEGKTAPIRDKVIFTTQGFSAPEILLHNDGNLQLGPEADIYSVGCLLLYLLTGQRANIRELIANRTGIYLRSNQLRRIQCPKHLIDSMQRILARALAKEPENRYHSVKDMLDEVTPLTEALQPKSTILGAVKYDAFICYKHGPVDSVAALTLQRALENYRAPKGVADKRRPFGRVFVDEGELSSCADFGQQIRDALKNSEWLIVICSPDTPLSPWVQLEIDTFLEYHDRSRILAVLTDGNPDISFPPQLKGDANGAGEVFAAHALSSTPQEAEKQLKGDALLKIAAPMLGTTYDTLKQRHKIYQLQRIAAITAGFLLATVGFTAYAMNRANVIAKQAVRIEEEYENALLNESRFLAEQAQKRLDDNDPLGAIELALQALPSAEQDRPILTEAEYVLGKALGIYTTPDSNFGTVTATGKIETSRDCFLLDDSGRYLFVWDLTEGGIQVWNANSMTLIRELYPNNTLGEYKPIGIIGNNIIVKHIYQIISIDFLTGEEKWSIEEENLVSVQVSNDRQHVLIFTRDEYVAGDGKSKDPDTLYLDILSAESGKVIRKINFPLDAQLRVEYDMCISEDKELVAIVVYDENNSDILYPNHSLYVLNLETGSCQHVFDSDTNIQALQFYGNKLAVIRSRGFSITANEGKIVTRAASEATAYFEAYDLHTWERLFSYEYHFYPKSEGICTIGSTAYDNSLTLGMGFLFTMDDQCFLLDQEAGTLIRKYVLPAAVMNIRYTQNGFETVNADGGVCVGNYTADSSEGWDSIFEKKYWTNTITKVCENGDFYYIQHTPFGISMDYTIIKYQKNQYDDGYSSSANLVESSWRYYTCCTLPEGIRTILKGNNQVCMVDIDGQVHIHSLPEAWSFGTYSEPVGVSEDGIRLYISVSDWSNDSLWINGSRYYVIDLLSGDVKELFYPELDGISAVSNCIFKDEMLFFKSTNWNTNEDEFYMWNMQNNTIRKICSISKEVSGERYAFSSMHVDVENNKLQFITEKDDYPSAPLCLISVDISSGDKMTVPMNFLQYSSDYFSWYDHPYVWNQSGTLVCIDWGESLYIVDSDGKLQQHIDINHEIIDIRFSLDEQSFFVFSKDGSVSRYQIYDGECKGKIRLSDHQTLNVAFFDAMNWKMTYLNENCLLIITDNQSFLLDISGAELKMRAVIDHCIAYDSRNDQFIVADMDGTSYELGTIPRYSLEELIQKGNAVLGR